MRAHAILLAIICCIIACTTVEAQVPSNFTVGIALPLKTNLGQRMSVAAQLAAQYVNDLEMIAGTVVNLVFRDTQGDHDTAYNIVQDFATSDVRAIIGGATEADALGLAAGSVNTSIPYLATGSVSSAIINVTNTNYPYTLRLIPSNLHQGRAFLDFWNAFLNLGLNVADRVNITFLTTDSAVGREGRAELQYFAAVVGCQLVTNEVELPSDPTQQTPAILSARLKPLTDSVNYETRAIMIWVNGSEIAFVLQQLEQYKLLFHPKTLYILNVESVSYILNNRWVDTETVRRAEGMLGFAHAAGMYRKVSSFEQFWNSFYTYITKRSAFTNPTLINAAVQTSFYIPGTTKTSNKNIVYHPSYLSVNGTLSYDMAEKYMWDAVVAMMEGFDILFAQQQDPNPLYWQTLHGRQRCFDAMRNISFVGATGGLCFTNLGERKPVRFSVVELLSSRLLASTTLPIINSTSTVFTLEDKLYDIVGHWNPMNGIDMLGPDLATYTGNALLLKDAILSWKVPTNYVPTDSMTYMTSYSQGFHTWEAAPTAFGSIPDRRFGACVVTAVDFDAMYVLGGTFSSTGHPIDDAWKYSFVTMQWSFLSVVGNRPPPRFYSACMQYGNYIYNFGGLSEKGVSGEVWRFNLLTNTYLLLEFNDLIDNAPRYQMGYGLGSKHIYMWGGRTLKNPVFEIWQLHVILELFQIKQPTYSPYPSLQPDLPMLDMDMLTVFEFLKNSIGSIGVRCDIGTSEIVFLLGGYNSFPDVNFIFDTNTYIISPFYSRGTQPGSRALTTAIFYPDTSKIYVSHGWSEEMKVNYNSVYSIDINCPSPTCGAWTYEMSWGDNRDSMPVVLLGRDMFTFGGWGQDEIHNDLWMVSPATQDYPTPLARRLVRDTDAPRNRKFHSACSLANQLIVFGGFGTPDGASTPQALNDLWVFDLDFAKWQLLSATNQGPTARYGHTAVALHQDMYLFGGYDGTNYFDEMWTYSLNLDAWELLDTTRTSTTSLNIMPLAPVPRAFHNAVPIGDNFMIVYGGNVAKSTAPTADMWSFSVLNATWTLIRNESMMIFGNENNYIDELARVAAEAAAAAAAAGGDSSKISVSDAPRITSGKAATNTTLVDVSFPTPVSQALMVVINTTIYLFGGVDQGSNPSAENHKIDPTTDALFIRLSDLPAARGSQVGAALGANVYLYGGIFYEVVNTDMNVYNTLTDTWSVIDQTRSWMTPRAIAGGSANAFGSYIFFFGGSSAQVTNVHVPTFTVPDTWWFLASPACSAENAPFPSNFPSCQPCSPGTVAVGSYCYSCPSGTYSIAGECTPCDRGFASPFSGAASFASCLPCANGTYAPNIGMSSCILCAEDAYCPVGSSYQMNLSSIAALTTFFQYQPQRLISNATFVTSVTTVLSYILAGLVGLIIAVYFYVMFAGYSDFLLRFDLLYAVYHYQKMDFPMYKRRTSMGGICTFMAAVTIAYMIVTLCLPFIIDNKIERRSLIPNVTVQNTTFSSHMQARVKLIGYQASCVAKPNTNICHRDVTTILADTTYVGAGMAATSCTKIEPSQDAKNNTLTALRSCEVVWDCLNCSATSVIASLSFSFMEQNTYASAIEWSILSSTGIPMGDAGNSILNGTIASEPDRVIRGTSQSSEIDVELTQTIYQETFSGVEDVGYHLDYISSTPGQKTVPKRFYVENGIIFNFALQKTLNSLTVVQDAKLTPIQFISQILGAVTGVIGGIGFAMGLLELIEDFIVHSMDRKELGSYGRLMKSLVMAREEAMIEHERYKEEQKLRLERAGQKRGKAGGRKRLQTPTKINGKFSEDFFDPYEVNSPAVAAKPRRVEFNPTTKAEDAGGFSVGSYRRSSSSGGPSEHRESEDDPDTVTIHIHPEGGGSPERVRSPSWKPLRKRLPPVVSFPSLSDDSLPPAGPPKFGRTKSRGPKVLPHAFTGGKDLTFNVMSPGMEPPITAVTLPSRLEMLGRANWSMVSTFRLEHIGNSILGLTPVWSFDFPTIHLRPRWFFHILPDLHSKAAAKMWFAIYFLSFALSVIFIIDFFGLVALSIGRIWIIGCTICTYAMMLLSRSSRVPSGTLATCRQMAAPLVEEYFFSYSWQQEEVEDIRTLSKAMWNTGVGVWIDVIKLCPGDETRPTIRSMIHKTYRTVLFISPEYCASEASCLELLEAIQHPSRCIFCILRPVEKSIMNFLYSLNGAKICHGLPELIEILDEEVSDSTDDHGFVWWRNQKVHGLGAPQDVVPTENWPVEIFSFTGRPWVPSGSVTVGPLFLAGDLKSSGKRIIPPYLFFLIILGGAINGWDLGNKYSDPGVHRTGLDYVWLLAIILFCVSPLLGLRRLMDTRYNLSTALKPLLASRGLTGGVRINVVGDKTDPVVNSLRLFLHSLAHLHIPISRNEVADEKRELAAAGLLDAAAPRIRMSQNAVGRASVVTTGSGSGAMQAAKKKLPPIQTARDNGLLSAPASNGSSARLPQNDVDSLVSSSPQQEQQSPRSPSPVSAEDHEYVMGANEQAAENERRRRVEEAEDAARLHLPGTTMKEWTLDEMKALAENTIASHLARIHDGIEAKWKQLRAAEQSIIDQVSERVVNVIVIHSLEERDAIFGPANAAHFDKHAIYVWTAPTNPYVTENAGDPMTEMMLNYSLLCDQVEGNRLAEAIFHAIAIRMVPLLHE